MAGRKLNEIDFILNAQMNSGFHGTFTKAQAEFKFCAISLQCFQKQMHCFPEFKNTCMSL